MSVHLWGVLCSYSRYGIVSKEQKGTYEERRPGSRTPKHSTSTHPAELIAWGAGAMGVCFVVVFLPRIARNMSMLS